MAGRTRRVCLAPLVRRLIAGTAAYLLVACTVAPLVPAAKGPEEGFAGTGQRVARIPVSQGNVLDALLMKNTGGGYVDILYRGLDSVGRAVFERRDSTAPAEADAPLIALDLRLTRQLRIQGRTIELLDATAGGLVYRLYPP